MKPDAFAAIRKRLRLTQAQLARRLGVSRVAVTRWETGVHPIPGLAARLMRRLDAERKAK